MSGNSSYSEIVRHGRKSFLVGTSMVRELTVKGMNKNMKNTSIRVGPLPRATVKQLHHYVIPTLTDHVLDTIIIR